MLRDDQTPPPDKDEDDPLDNQDPNDPDSGPVDKPDLPDESTGPNGQKMYCNGKVPQLTRTMHLVNDLFLAGWLGLDYLYTILKFETWKQYGTWFIGMSVGQVACIVLAISQFISY